MKTMKKTFALLLAVVMALSLAMPAMAVDNQHTITINNSDANGNHSYEGYQVFKGNLDAEEDILSDIEWGTGVNSAGIINALAAEKAKTGNNATALTTALASFDIHSADNTATPAVAASTAVDVAKFIASLGDNSANLDAVARIINDNLNASGKITFTGSKEANYTATVPNDGYYFIKDTTTAANLPEGDTVSKFMLEVVKDVTINAKDTSITPDKDIINSSEQRVDDDSAAIGDLVTFEVKIPVPDTTNYKDHFVFNMKDQLPVGLTFMRVTKIEIGTLDNNDKLTTVDKTLAATDYTVTAKANGAADTAYAAYNTPESNAAAVTAA